MHYVMIDTNIFIDMIIDRRYNVSDKLVESFIKLLDYDEIKLVIPEIVVHETNKHIDRQLFEVGERIKKVIKVLDEVCGINGYKIEKLEIRKYKNISQKQWKEILEKYNDKKDEYAQAMKAMIQKIFGHKNCIIIEDTEWLRSLCLKRRIYKRAPFHIVKKESYADGIIVETLVHLSEFVSIDKSDSIILVTGNTSDFSSQDKTALHKDIEEDLLKRGLLEQTKYVLSFNELIGKELAKEVENADLKMDFEEQMRHERHQWLQDIEDAAREAVGLSALSGFEDKFLDSFRDSSFVEEMTNLFERFDLCLVDLGEVLQFYRNELSMYMNNIDTEEIGGFLEKWNNLMVEIDEQEVSYDISGIKDILKWIEEKIKSIDYLYLLEELPESLEYGDKITLYDIKKNKYELSMDKLMLSCESGERDFLGIYLCDERGKIASGMIEVDYGFFEYNDDGGVADSREQDIDYQTEAIVEAVKEILVDWEEFVSDEQKLTEEIGYVLDI